MREASSSQKEHPILVVEDDVQDLELIKESLGRMSQRFVCCTSGKVAAELFDPRKFAAVLLNLRLPDMDGMELLRMMRRRSAETLIVIVTGVENPERRRLAIEAGASEFFEKPYSVIDHQVVINLLRGQSAAYDRGRKVKHWRTTAWGGISALGTFLITFGMVLVQLDSIPRPVGVTILIAGVIIQGAGIVGSSICGADKKTVDEYMRPWEHTK